MCDAMAADPKLQEKFNQTHKDYKYSPRSKSIKIFNFKDIEDGEGLMYDYEEERFDRIMREKIVYMKSGIIRFMVGNPTYPIDTSIVFREIK